MDYFIRQDKSPGSYVVAKYESDRRYPIETYKVSASYCTCPSPKYPCKHVELVNLWKAVPNHEQYYYSDVDNMFHVHPFGQ